MRQSQHKTLTENEIINLLFSLFFFSLFMAPEFFKMQMENFCSYCVLTTPRTSHVLLDILLQSNYNRNKHLQHSALLIDKKYLYDNQC